MEHYARGQVSGSAAEVYEKFFVPALFGQWAAPLAEAARVAPGQDVLDVACGTGVFARTATSRTAPGGTVTGLDCNEDMLAVAGQIEPGIDWRLGQAESLPFDNDRFDVVACQFALMFFEDRVRALREMRRVLRPGGRLALAVWDGLDGSPGYAAMVALLQRLFGAPAADALRAPFVLGDADTVLSLLKQAGIEDAGIETRNGTAAFPSIESWVHTDVRGWTLADMIDEAQYRTLLAEAQRELRRFAATDGTVSFAAPAHIAMARKG